jgi:hypothetical protein
MVQGVRVRWINFELFALSPYLLITLSPPSSQAVFLHPAI